MKLKEYCECGASISGNYTPDSVGFQLKRSFWMTHSGKGHSLVEPSECYSVRRREELRSTLQAKGNK